MIAASVAYAAMRPLQTRSADELRHDLVAACGSLGELAAEWTATGYVPRADIEAVDRTIEGVRRLLVQLRAGGADG
jgi:malonyl CoA-acyl carrier protein transacylase